MIQDRLVLVLQHLCNRAHHGSGQTRLDGFNDRMHARYRIRFNVV